MMQTSANRRRGRGKLLLAGEVAIKPAMREPSGCHDLANRDLGEASSVEEAGCRSDDPVSCLLLVNWGVRHPASKQNTNGCYRTKDDLEHLLSQIYLASRQPGAAGITP